MTRLSKSAWLVSTFSLRRLSLMRKKFEPPSRALIDLRDERDDLSIRLNLPRRASPDLPPRSCFAGNRTLRSGTAHRYPIEGTGRLKCGSWDSRSFCTVPDQLMSGTGSKADLAANFGNGWKADLMRATGLCPVSPTDQRRSVRDASPLGSRRARRVAVSMRLQHESRSTYIP